MSSSLIRAIARARSSDAFLSSNSVNSSKEGSRDPTMRWITSEKLSPCLFAALSLLYAESSREMVFVPMHLCMCMHVFQAMGRDGERLTWLTSLVQILPRSARLYLSAAKQKYVRLPSRCPAIGRGRLWCRSK